jgi:hypothetical protein
MIFLPYNIQDQDSLLLAEIITGILIIFERGGTTIG